MTPETTPASTAPARGQALLEMDGVAVRLGGRTLVERLALTLHAGQRLALVGPNGSGKSTLLRVLAGLHPADAGQLRRPADPPGMLFQQGGLWAHMTVEQHLAFVDTAGDRAWREHLLELFGLEALRHRRPEHLSGGEQVRLALARALAGRPRWVLLDEPLAHLDPAVRAEVRSRLPAALDELGAAAVIVTHHAEDVALFAPDLLCLTGDGGWWAGPSAEALEHPPNAPLAACSERGTLLQGRADARGGLDFGLDLRLEGLTPDAPAAAFLRADAVTVSSPAEDAPANGRFVAADQRGGCWVRAHGLLLRSATPPGGRAPDTPVTIRITGPLAALAAARHAARDVGAAT